MCRTRLPPLSTILPPCTLWACTCSRHTSSGRSLTSQKETSDARTLDQVLLFGQRDALGDVHTYQNMFVENSSPISNMIIGLQFGALIFGEKHSKDKFTAAGL